MPLKIVMIIGKEGCQLCREALDKASNEPNTVALYNEFANLPLNTRRKITNYFRKEGKEFQYPLVIESLIQ